MDSAGFLTAVREQVDRCLAEFLNDKRGEARAISPESERLVEAIESLTMRGGKRFRPALLTASFLSVAPDRDPAEVVSAGAALELLQSYLLIHDDWMDGDEERRGGPAVHIALGRAHRDPHLGACLAILAGDMANTHAWELLMRVDGPRADLVNAFITMQNEVVFGQQLDLMATEDVSLMQQLKTGSYTVRGPIRLGALCAHADEAQLKSLLAYADPLGEAFQMRDDLLGTFGDRERLGKPTLGDLKAGKRTALIRAAFSLSNDAQRAAIEAVLGNPEADDPAAQRAVDALVDSGAKAQVEKQLRALLAQAIEALAAAPLRAPGTDHLRTMAEMLAVRDR